ATASAGFSVSFLIAAAGFFTFGFALAATSAFGAASSVIARANTSLSPLTSNASVALIERDCDTNPARLTSSACDFDQSILWMVYGVLPTRLPSSITSAPGGVVATSTTFSFGTMAASSLSPAFGLSLTFQSRK